MNLKIDKIWLDDIKIKDFKYLSIEILIEIINENQENFDLPKKEIIKSLCTYLIKKDLLTKKIFQ